VKEHRIWACVVGPASKKENHQVPHPGIDLYSVAGVTRFEVGERRCSSHVSELALRSVGRQQLFKTARCLDASRKC